MRNLRNTLPLNLTCKYADPSVSLAQATGIEANAAAQVVLDKPRGYAPVLSYIRRAQNSARQSSNGEIVAPYEEDTSCGGERPATRPSFSEGACSQCARAWTRRARFRRNSSSARQREGATASEYG